MEMSAHIRPTQNAIQCSGPQKAHKVNITQTNLNSSALLSAHFAAGINNTAQPRDAAGPTRSTKLLPQPTR